MTEYGADTVPGLHSIATRRGPRSTRPTFSTCTTACSTASTRSSASRCGTSPTSRPPVGRARRRQQEGRVHPRPPKAAAHLLRRAGTPRPARDRPGGVPEHELAEQLDHAAPRLEQLHHGDTRLLRRQVHGGVSAGDTIAAIGTSSHPTTLTASGDQDARRGRPTRPSRPAPIWSLKATTAVAAEATTDSTASAASSNVGLTATSCTCTPRDSPQRLAAVRRSLPAHEPFGPPR